MKNNEVLREQTDYTVTENEFAKEMLPLVKDFFTADAKETAEGKLLVTFTNGEKFEICVKKLQ